MLHDAFTLGLLRNQVRMGLVIHPYPTPLDDPTLFLFWTTVVRDFHFLRSIDPSLQLVDLHTAN